ncbi:MAG TPA: methionyl-tRNA formyltransferase [Mycobacteriales bacterium]|nr:methionyl-tRNA formyltransferase [Mycobacteriales bacterium]
MRLLFAGTPAAALPALAALLDSSRHQVVGVLTRPDARAGRGRALAPSPVKELAAARQVPVLTPRTLRDDDAVAGIHELAPDCCPVVAYGNLIPPAALRIPPDGWVNLHFSLLPAWRGAAPVQHAIWHGDEITGASTFLIEEGLDTGPLFGVLTETVRARDTAGDLLGRLAEAGAQLLCATLDAIEDGSIRAEPQSTDGVSLAPKITSEDARIDWRASAVAVDRQVRACTPVPGAWTVFRGQRIKVGPVLPVTTTEVSGEPLAPGELDLPRVGTGAGEVRLDTVQPAGKAPMDAAAWARGIRPQPGERLDDA